MNEKRQLTGVDRGNLRQCMHYLHHWKSWKTGKCCIFPPRTSKKDIATKLFRDIEEGSVSASVVTLCQNVNVVTEEDDPVGAMLPRCGCHLVPHLANREHITIEFVVRDNDTIFRLPISMRIDDTEKLFCLGSMNLVGVKPQGYEVVTQWVLLEHCEHFLQRPSFR